jgi:hypothetical protein
MDIARSDQQVRAAYDRAGADEGVRAHTFSGFLVISLLAALLTSFWALWPEVYEFATPRQHATLTRLAEAPIHLADDVMISLRAGYMLRDTGRPTFNRTDLAQPSTSYVAPYLFAALLKVLPDNFAIAAYALLGLLAVGATAGCLFYFSKSSLNAAVLIAALLVTQTNFHFSLNGWDHLIQGLLMAFATGLVLRGATGRFDAFIASIVIALGCLVRPDGAIIGASLLFVLYLTLPDIRRFLLQALLPFCLVVFGTLWLNHLQFGHFTPTTAWLKVGAAPSLGYIVKYVLVNGIVSYTTLTFLALIGVFFFLFRSVLADRRSVVISAACLATALFALYNSDVFPGARMLWMPASVMAVTLSVLAPPFFETGAARLEGLFRVSPIYGRMPKAVSVQKLATMFGLVVGLLAISADGFLRQAVVTADKVRGSQTAQQYVIMSWIRDHLTPTDGAIGLFYLGLGYHIPRFEVADFLGKADEAIADTRIKWGPPGHNKWDIDLTLDKWNPQAIVPAAPSDPNKPGALEEARKVVSARRSFAFVSELMINDRIAKFYRYCYVPGPQAEISDEWGFFVRADIVDRFRGSLRCASTSVPERPPD